MGVSVTVKSNIDLLNAEVAKKIPIALEKCGLVAEGYAKRLSPVDTGRLRNSITHTTDDDTVYIGTNVEYAPYVEYGTRYTRAQPFIEPAVVDHIDEYESIIENTLKE